MKKYSGVFRITENQNQAVRALCAKYSISRSELFRRIILWAIASKLHVPKQTATFRFATVNGKGETKQSSFLFGSKLSSDILMKINDLCKFFGVKESHLYRCFFEGYIMAQNGGVTQRPLVRDRPISNPKEQESHNFPYAIFRNANFTQKLPKPDASTLIGRIQASHIEAIETGKHFSDAVGLAVVLISIISHK